MRTTVGLRFLYGYMEEDQLHHLYKSGSTFEQAINLYLFDKELRQLIFKAIQDIEISLRTKMIQVFSMEHGTFCSCVHIVAIAIK